MAHVLFSRISGLSKRSGYVEHCAIKNLREKADVEEGGVLKTLLSIFMCGSCFRKKIIAYKTMSFLSAGLSKVTNNGDNKLDGSANSQTNSQSTFQASKSKSQHEHIMSFRAPELRKISRFNLWACSWMRTIQKRSRIESR